MIKVYRNTATIKAEQFDGSEEMVDKYHVILNGWEYINAGDWIATGANGEHWGIANDIFKKTYAGLPVIPKVVADWIDKCKHNGIAIASAMDEDKFPKEVAYYFRTYYTRDQWIEIQDTFVRAWLDGYTVEEDK